MLDCSDDEGDVWRIKEFVEETKPSLANVMVSTNLSNGGAGWLTEKRGNGKSTRFVSAAGIYLIYERE